MKRPQSQSRKSPKSTGASSLFAAPCRRPCTTEQRLSRDEGEDDGGFCRLFRGGCCRRTVRSYGRVQALWSAPWHRGRSRQAVRSDAVRNLTDLEEPQFAARSAVAVPSERVG